MVANCTDVKSVPGIREHVLRRCRRFAPINNITGAEIYGRVQDRLTAALAGT